MEGAASIMNLLDVKVVVPLSDGNKNQREGMLDVEYNLNLLLI